MGIFTKSAKQAFITYFYVPWRWEISHPERCHRLSWKTGSPEEWIHNGWATGI